MVTGRCREQKSFTRKISWRCSSNIRKHWKQKNRQLEEALDQADIHGLRLMVVEDNELNAEIT